MTESAAIQTLATFLALQDEPRPVDVGVLVGNGVLECAATFAEAYHADWFPRVFVCGGIGHSTADLRERMAVRYPNVVTEGRAESEMFREVLVTEFVIPPEMIEIENRSTNCGGNAAETRAELDRLGWAAGSLLLVQDPTMQRRTDATFRRVWAERPHVQFVNRPPFIPEIVGNEVSPNAWPGDRFLTLLLGEIPRLRDDETGYGPRGKGFIVHVDIPDEVEAAFRLLLESQRAIVGSRILG